MNKEEKLEIETLKRGEGKEATKGDKVLVHYTGELEDGTEFDSSVKRDPISFTLGKGEVIEGWEKGVLGMKKGGKRKLVINSDLAYGEKGIPGTIPGGATLIFEVELVEVN